jgi:hypothetical protein
MQLKEKYYQISTRDFSRYNFVFQENILVETVPVEMYHWEKV